jgi:hypothetical protein
MVEILAIAVAAMSRPFVVTARMIGNDGGAIHLISFAMLGHFGSV